MSKDGIASGFAVGYDPTGRSLFFKKKDKIPSFDPPADSLFNKNHIPGLTQTSVYVPK